MLTCRWQQRSLQSSAVFNSISKSGLFWTPQSQLKVCVLGAFKWEFSTFDSQQSIGLIASWAMWLRAVLFTLAGQVSKFPSAFWVRRNAANIDRDLGFSRFPVQMCWCVWGDVCLNHEALAAAAPGAPAPPTGPLLSGVCNRWGDGE